MHENLKEPFEERLMIGMINVIRTNDQFIPIKTQYRIVMWQWVAYICLMRFPEMSSMVSVWCISFPIPIIPLEMLMICTPIFCPSLIAFLVFISLSVENILHAAYTLLGNHKELFQLHHYFLLHKQREIWWGMGHRNVSTDIYNQLYYLRFNKPRQKWE